MGSKDIDSASGHASDINRPEFLHGAVAGAAVVAIGDGRVELPPLNVTPTATSIGLQVNLAGTIAGYSTAVSGTQHATRWTLAGVPTDLRVPQSSCSVTELLGSRVAVARPRRGKISTTAEASPGTRLMGASAWRSSGAAPECR